MRFRSDRLPAAVAIGLALTAGAGAGAVARGDHVVVRHVAARPAPSPTPTQKTSPTLSEQVAQIARNGGFAFLDPPGSNGEVDRWDPCVSIHYVVNVVEGPATATADIAWAFARLGALTGMRFVNDGATKELPDDRRKDVRHTPAGWRWAPVLVALVPDSVFHGKGLDADKDSLAYTDPDIYGDDAGDSQIVSGQVVIDADEITDGGHADPGALGPTLLHELGHLVGLDHVRVKNQIMQPDGGGQVDYGAGDQRGLRYVGRSHGCVPDSALPTDSDDFPK